MILILPARRKAAADDRLVLMCGDVYYMISVFLDRELKFFQFDSSISLKTIF